MRWVRPARLPLLIAWAVIVGVVSWLVLHPALIAPYASRMVSRHLLRLEGGGLQVRDFRVRLFEGMDLYGVSLTLTGQDGAVTLVSADTVAVDFRLREALGSLPRLRRVTVGRPEVYARSGHTPDDETKAATTSSQPQLSIDHLVVNEAYLEFSGADGRLSERISRLNWRGAVHAEQDVRLLLRGCDVHWDTHLSVLEGLRGEVKLDREGVTATQIFGTLNDHRVEVSGSRTWAGALDLTVKGQGVNVEEVENLIDQSIGFVADGDIDGTFDSVADTLVYNGVFSGLLEGYQVRNLAGRAAIGHREVLLSGLSGVINGASFAGGGRFDISRGDSIAFVLEGDVTDVDLTRGLVPGEQDLPQTDGRGRLRIEHTAHPLWTRVSGRMLDGFVATIPFDTCLVDVEAAGDSLRFNHIDLRYRDLHALVTGATDTADVFRGELSGASGNLASLPAQWHWPALGGRLEGHGELNGPVDDLGFAGWLKVNDFELSAVRAGFAEAALVVGDVLGDPVYSTGIDGRDLSVGDVPCGDFLLWGSASARGASVDSFRSVLGRHRGGLRPARRLRRHHQHLPRGPLQRRPRGNALGDRRAHALQRRPRQPAPAGHTPGIGPGRDGRRRPLPARRDCGRQSGAAPLRPGAA